jgi:hypothetical protein
VLLFAKDLNQDNRMRFQFSLAGLMGGVAFVAVSIAALRFASELWAALAFTLTVVALVGSLLGCMLRPAGMRRASGAFALAGWVYVILVFGPWFNIHARPRLISTHLARYCQPKLQELVRAMQDSDHARQMQVKFESNVARTIYPGPPWSRFEQVFHCIATWVFAFAAASLSGRWLAGPAKSNGEPLASVPQLDGVISACGRDGSTIR